MLPARHDDDDDDDDDDVIIITTPLEFFTSVSADGLSLEFE